MLAFVIDLPRLFDGAGFFSSLCFWLCESHYLFIYLLLTAKQYQCWKKEQDQTFIDGCVFEFEATNHIFIVHSVQKQSKPACGLRKSMACVHGVACIEALIGKLMLKTALHVQNK